MTGQVLVTWSTQEVGTDPQMVLLYFPELFSQILTQIWCNVDLFSSSYNVLLSLYLHVTNKMDFLQSVLPSYKILLNFVLV